MRTIVAVVGILWLGAPQAAETPPRPQPSSDASPVADTKAAEDAARAWLALLDGGRYAESWGDTAQLFQRAVPKEQWERQAAAVRDPLGKLVKRELRSATPRSSLPGAPDGAYVVLQFETAFEHKQAAVETVTPARDPDGRWRVSGYFIR
jgi:hypothetical protein